MDRRFFLKASGGLALSAAGLGLVAGTFPVRAQVSGGLTLIVPGPGGSRSGLAGRMLGSALQRELGEAVEVIPVDSPREGYMMLASAPTNGRTFGLIGADMPALNRGIGNSPGVGSIAPVAMLSIDPAGIHVRRDAPWRNAGEMIASLRSTPRSLKASGAGRHAVWHISAQRWMMASGASAGALTWQAAANPAEAVDELAAGGPDIVVCSIPEVRASPQAKQVRTLAVMRSARSARYPEVAAVRESGPAISAGWWRGVAGPRGIDGQHIARMQSALQRVSASAAYRADMARRGFTLEWAGAGQFAQFIAREDRAMAAAIRAMA